MLSGNRLWRSFRYACRGLWRVIGEEQNFALELAIAVGVVLLAALSRFRAVEWAILILTIGLVLLMEVFNSAVERAADLLKPRLDIYVKEIKDIMAGAVLLVAATAVVVGVFLFGPRVIKLFTTII